MKEMLPTFKYLWYWGLTDNVKFHFKTTPFSKPSFPVTETNIPKPTHTILKQQP